MLSGPRALASASEASNYMLHEYLVRNDEAHRTANRWHGGGAEALGLSQRVSRRRFVAVLEGHVPGTDIRLGRVVDGEHQHHPGVVKHALLTPRNPARSMGYHADRHRTRAPINSSGSAGQSASIKLPSQAGPAPRRRRARPPLWPRSKGASAPSSARWNGS